MQRSWLASALQFPGSTQQQQWPGSMPQQRWQEHFTGQLHANAAFVVGERIAVSR
jgi:hypothetical protein